MTDTASLAQQLLDTAEEIAELEKQRYALRKELFDLATEENDQPFYNVPTKSIELPEGFLKKVGLTKEEFFETRYPGWKIIAEQDNVYILKKLAQYLPWEYVDPETHIKVAKQIQESTPDVDWESLQKDDPDLYKELGKIVSHLELNEERFMELSDEKPEIIATLQRHLIMKTPVQRLPKPVVVKDES